MAKWKPPIQAGSGKKITILSPLKQALPGRRRQRRGTGVMGLVRRHVTRKELSQRNMELMREKPGEWVDLRMRSLGGRPQGQFTGQGYIVKFGSGVRKRFNAEGKAMFPLTRPSQRPPV